MDLDLQAIEDLMPVTFLRSCPSCGSDVQLVEPQPEPDREITYIRLQSCGRVIPLRTILKLVNEMR